MIIQYETGIEEPNILESGSSYYSVFRTNDEQEAIRESCNNFRTYLIKIVWDNGKRKIYSYNNKTKVFE